MVDGCFLSKKMCATLRSEAGAVAYVAIELRAADKDIFRMAVRQRKERSESQEVAYEKFRGRGFTPAYKFCQPRSARHPTWKELVADVLTCRHSFRSKDDNAVIYTLIFISHIYTKYIIILR